MSTEHAETSTFEGSPKTGVYGPIYLGQAKRARPAQPRPPQEFSPEDPGTVIRLIVTPADLADLDAEGGAEAVGELLTEAVERYGLRRLLEHIAEA